MPIPVIEDHFAAQVIFHGKTGQPEDVYTNTFYFRNDDVISNADDVADAIQSSLHEFYNVAPTTVASPVAISSMLSSGTINLQYDVRVYDLGVAAPRYPKIRTSTLTSAPSTTLPSEVAVCLSYVAQQNQPRNRGRIYIGPLSQGVITVDAGRATVGAQYRTSMLASAMRLLAKGQTTWCIYSPTDGVMKPITGFWADNAFDIQRRRGEKPTSRLTTGTYLGQQGTQVVYL